MNTKNFDLSTILSLLTGRLLAPIENIYISTSFLIGKECYTMGLAEYQELCQNFIYEKYPNLALIEIPENIIGWEKVNEFIEEQKKIYGNEFELTPIPKEIVEEYNNRKNLSL